MKTIKVQSEELQNALTYVAKIGNSLGGLTDYVVLNAENGYLSLSTTNGGDWLSHRVCCSGDDITEPIAVGMEWMKGACPCEGTTITLEFDGGFVTARTIDAEIVGPFLSAEKTSEKFPKRKEAITDGQIIHVKHTQIVPALKAVEFALAKDEVRVVMTGVYVNLLDDKHAELAATDGRVIMTKAIRLNNVQKADVSAPYEGFIPHPFAIKIVKGLVGDLEINVKGNAMEITCGDAYCRTKCIEGRYPNYRAAIPSADDAIRAKVSKASLKSAIKRAATYQDTVIGLEVSNGKVSLYTLNYELGTSTSASIPALCETPEPIIVGVSAVFFTKILTNICGENVVLNVKDSSKPITIEGADETMVSLIMPMLIDHDPRQGLVKTAEETKEDDEETEAEETEETKEAEETEETEAEEETDGTDDGL